MKRIKVVKEVFGRGCGGELNSKRNIANVTFVRGNRATNMRSTIRRRVDVGSRPHWHGDQRRIVGGIRVCDDGTGEIHSSWFYQCGVRNLGIRAISSSSSSLSLATQEDRIASTQRNRASSPSAPPPPTRTQPPPPLPPPSSSSSSPIQWYSVAKGAQMIFSAVIQQSVSEATKVGRQAAHHGIDLATKASSSFNDNQRQQPSSSSSSQRVPLSSLIQEVVTVAAEQWIQRQRHQQSQHEEQPTDGTTISQGTAPYESQLRRKLQRQQHDASFDTSKPLTAIQDPVGEDVDGYSPYLFHAPRLSSGSKLPAPEEELQERMSGTDALTASNLSTTISSNHSTQQPETPSIVSSSPTATVDDDTSSSTSTTRLQEGRAVPSTRFGRALGFASLGAGLAWGAVGELANRAIGRSSSSSVITTDANADRLAATLCRMRGAALKMGQMLSIQDESLLPPALTRALQQVRQGAEAMPSWQLHKQLEDQLGAGWRSKFVSFDEQPFAAASIGQVHRAKILDRKKNSREDHVGDNIPLKDVVVKVQFPGVAQSIESDLGNLSMLVRMSGLSPRGLFIENVIRVGRDELKVECNYRNELANQEAFQKLVHDDPILRSNKFVVPDVIEELSTEQVLTTAYAPGGTIDKVAQFADQSERNRIGRTILYLTMQELFEWRLMQTDPNWGNFLYDPTTKTTSLIDFGASREFPVSFVDGYLRIVWASANRDEMTLMEQSHKMKFLTGEENGIMLNAHKLSGFTVGEPFWNDEPFDFRGSNISSRMSEHTSVFLRHRLTPPPEEVYTLHRKLAGAYMLCIKLGSVIKCRDMLESVVRNHRFEDGLPNPITGK